jgi:serine protease Do
MKQGVILLLPCLALAPAAGAAPGRANTDFQQEIYDARDAVLPALVHVEPILEVYARGQKAKEAVTGSGVIIDDAGHVVTNDHVVANATRVTCILTDKREFTARVVGRDSSTDVAVLALDLGDAKVPHATLGRSAGLQAGQHVVAMGSPLGLARSLSAGVVSTPDRYFPEDFLPSGEMTGTYNTWVQTDAAINPGNSGGPLVDMEGHVIGINARAVPVFGENIGFAIPIDVVKEVAGQLIASGKVTRSWVGALFQETKSLAGWFGTRERGGVLVGGLFPDGPADHAGLHAGDIIVEWNGKPVSARFEEELPAFRKLVADSPIGATVPMTVVRNGAEMKLSVITQEEPLGQGAETEAGAWGFTVRDITPDLARRRRIEDPTGAYVTGVKPSAPASVAGIEEGDIIREVENEPVKDSAALREKLEALTKDARPSIMLRLERGRTHRVAVLEPPRG